MAEGEDQASKTEAPSQRKLDEARRKGDVAKSQDLPAFMAVSAATGVLLFAGGGMATSMAAMLQPFISHPEAIDLTGRGAEAVMMQAARASAPGLAVLAAAAVAGAAGNFVQHGLLWAPSKLAPELSKLNPLEGFKRIFGLDAGVQFLKSLVKILAIGAVAWWVMKPKVEALTRLADMEPAGLLPLSVDFLRALCIAVLLVLGLVAGADWLWARQRFMQKMRMSREELRQDTKESDGDPHVKARQKQIRIQRSRKRMMQNMPKATVVVTNPTHYAVALRYVQGETAAPVCVAKGLDSLALKIRAAADKHGVPIVEDPPLARSLYAAIEIDETIPREHYQAVAKIIGFVMGGGRGKPPPPARTGAARL